MWLLAEGYIAPWDAFAAVHSQVTGAGLAAGRDMM